MRIGLISYEFVGDRVGGGIGTYVRNAAEMLARRGHNVEIFTSGTGATLSCKSGSAVHPVTAARQEFARRVLPPFSARHSVQPFDVIEGPEYGADAAEVAKAFPALPLVVRLHTPTCLINEVNNSYLPWHIKARYLAGGVLRGRIPNRFWVYDSESDVERAHALHADVIAAPSHANSISS